MRPIFPQNVIALVWDFDKTLSRGYMQAPLFDRFGVDERGFWEEANGLRTALRRSDSATSDSRGAYRVNEETIYLNLILDYVRAGIFKGLTNADLRELGGGISLFPGLPDAFPALKAYVNRNPHYQQFDIRLEHYIVSTGLREMIVGSQVFAHVDGVWGCEFAAANPAPVGHQASQLSFADLPSSNVITQVAYAIDNTSKTRAIFEINKGSNRYPGEIDVNSFMRPEDRRVPITNMIYVADGPSDIPVFSVVGGGGGKCCAVYPKGDVQAFRQANELQQQGRVAAVAEANYQPCAQAMLWLEAEIDRIAGRMVASKKQELVDQVGRPARHLPAKTAEQESSAVVRPAIKSIDAVELVTVAAATEAALKPEVPTLTPIDSARAAQEVDATSSTAIRRRIIRDLATNDPGSSEDDGLNSEVAADRNQRAPRQSRFSSPGGD